MPFVVVDGRRVHYLRRLGGRRAIVFVHGGFGSSAELWSQAMAALPAEYSGYAIDNFIHSEAPKAGYTVQAFADRVAGFAAALNLRRPVLVGHSMGGIVCQLTALNHPISVGALVLVCTGARAANLGLAHCTLAVLREKGMDEATMRSISANWFYQQPADGFFQEYVARAMTAPLDGIISAQKSHIATDLRDRLHEIAAPTLVVFGRHDTGRTFDHAETLLAGIRGSTLATMERSGHSPMVETPGDFNDALGQFLGEIL